ncbi:MAG: hypothetical protein MUE52_04740 [Tabrizicola sp.]|jgi:hypothetical protein|nr:hypothetical protein [Tabrizicola sp.]
MRLLPALVLLGLPGLAAAQTVAACDDYRSNAQAIAEPWEANTRLFSEGEVRLAVLDTIEPAAGAFHLLILSPPYDEVGGRQCAVVSSGEGAGFAGLDLTEMTAGYDPVVGLTFAIPATRWVPDTDDFVPAVLSVTLHQATGEIGAVLE